jgi:hypothetical protein
MTSEEYRDSPLPVYSGESSDGFTNEREEGRCLMSPLTTEASWRLFSQQLRGFCRVRLAPSGGTA